ncbi:Uma2 family endonuclease [Solirubrobacter phytolaccae]|uniref:Uma2 family endonuclease n=1 Tax=Solirubrobacter phytolaccae TaxID=1404360 RepID=A0A9X3NGH9_9ACTN|nr:Uma2 family endonuclease [Solirubrobacter phytolaccae]MDA0184687.1 Uma2 family endonuclease [Solirubrobacter phytolaccae]
MSTAVDDRLTVEEFLAREWPRGTQLIDGHVVVSQPTPLHQHVVLEIGMALRLWTQSPTGRGTAILSLDVVYDTSVLAPDVLWFEEPLPLDTRRAEKAANLLVEVRSRSTWHYDLGRKRELYLEHGVPELWLVDTVGRRVIVHRSDGVWERHAEEDLISPQMPEFRATVGDLIPAL